jgi:hypothetical protein
MKEDLIELAVLFSEEIDQPILVGIYKRLPLISYRLAKPEKKIVKAVSPKVVCTNQVIKASDFVRYFYKKYKQQTGLLYAENWATDSRGFKMKIQDWFYSNGFQDDEIYRFIDWVFEKKSTPVLSWMTYDIPRYVQEKGLAKKKKLLDEKKKVVTGEMSDKEKEIASLARKEALEYYGCGYFDEKLTREEYFVGLHWRIKNLSKVELKELKGHLQKKFSNGKYPGMLEKLEEWRKEFYQIQDFDFEQEFYEVVAKRNGTTVDEIRRRFNVNRI